jgi:hypothetical protein
MGPKVKGVRFRAANGQELKYYGTKSIKFYPEGHDQGLCDMGFHVTDTTKPLAAATAIVRMGNRIVFEGGAGKSYIENLATVRRVPLKESGGTYMFEAECVDGSVFSGQE